MRSGLVGKSFFEVFRLTAPLFLKGGAQMTLLLTCVSIVLGGVCMGLLVALLRCQKGRLAVW